MLRKPILIMAGGTGGHVYPALAVANYLRGLGVPLMWLGTRRGMEARVVPQAGYRFTAVTIMGIRGKGLTTWIAAPFRLLLALCQSAWVLHQNRPAAVLGMGGFVSGPGGVAAWLMRIPLLIHEQNAIVGMTNRLLARIASQVMEAFPGSFPARRRAIHTGNPIREAICKIPLPAERLRADPRCLGLLILGGSQGARRLNEVIPAALARLKSLNLSIRHQCGERHVDATRARYARYRLNATVEPFIEDMALAYMWADLVLCRSGAITVSELAVVGVASVLIPYPFAVDDHQTANARYLVDAEAAVLIPEEELDENRLAAVIKELHLDRERLAAMGERARELAVTSGARRVGDLCLQEADG